MQGKVLRKSTRDRALDEADPAYKRAYNRTWTAVEHAFGIVKCLWGYRNARYRCLAKNTSRLTATFALANSYMERYLLMTKVGQVRPIGICRAISARNSRDSQTGGDPIDGVSPRKSPHVESVDSRLG